MRSKLGVEDFGDSSNFLSFPNSSDTTESWLQDGGTSSPQQSSKLSLGTESLSRSYWNPDRLRDLCKFQQIVRWNRLLEPKGAIWFQFLTKTNGSSGCELTMGAKQKIGSIPNRFSQNSTKLHGPRDISQGRHVSSPHRVGPSWVKLECGVASIHQFQRTLCRHLW